MYKTMMKFITLRTAYVVLMLAVGCGNNEGGSFKSSIEHSEEIVIVWTSKSQRYKKQIFNFVAQMHQMPV